jgi:Ca2+-binding RTX toxin-like protein
MSPREHRLHLRPKAIAAGVLSAAGLAAALGIGATPASAATGASIQNGTLRITGDKASDKVGLITADPSQLIVDVGEDGTADFSFDPAMFSAVAVSAGAGDDEVRIGNGNALTGKAVTVDGGAGDDTLLGGNNPESFVGGSGADFVDGNIGADTAQLGAGDDVFQWDPGDGSDVVDGGAGNDKLAFHGSNIGETMDLSAQGTHARLFRDVAAINMDLAAVEDVAVSAIGGADQLTVNDLAGTDVRTAEADLSATGGGDDGSADTVIVNGTAADDRIDAAASGDQTQVTGTGTRVLVGGAAAGDRVRVNGAAGQDTLRYRGTSGDDAIGIANDGTAAAAFGATSALVDAATENLEVDGLDGADTLAAQNGLASLTKLTLDGGAGGDDLHGGDGADLLLGGDGDDTVDGNIGTDDARLGAGDDQFQWDPGDGSDVIDGQSGSDRLQFNGSNIGERIDITHDGAHMRLFRDVAAIAMDASGMESLGVRALGGTDAIHVGDLKRTGITDADIDLGASSGGGDGAVDSVILEGTNGADAVQVTRDGTDAVVAGLPTHTRIAGGEGANDSLSLFTFGGDDDVSIAPDVSDVIRSSVNLGSGE